MLWLTCNFCCLWRSKWKSNDSCSNLLNLFPGRSNNNFVKQTKTKTCSKLYEWIKSERKLVNEVYWVTARLTFCLSDAEWLENCNWLMDATLLAIKSSARAARCVMMQPRCPLSTAGSLIKLNLPWSTTRVGMKNYFHTSVVCWFFCAINHHTTTSALTECIK